VTAPILARVRRRLFEGETPFLAAGPSQRRRALQAHVERLILEEAPLVGPAVGPAEVSRMASTLVSEVTGFGPLEPLLGDPDIVEIMVNAPDEILVERAGRLEQTGIRFPDEAGIRQLIEKVVGPLGLRADESRPIVDARLGDGSRFHAVLPPVALRSPTVTIRKFRRKVFSLDELVAMGTFPEDAALWLAGAVAGRANVCVSGGTSSGKTSLLNALSRVVPPGERIVTIEDAAELRLEGHVVGLEARPSNAEGRGAVTIRDLVRAALRLRPDRIVVGEVRDGAALDMLAALNTGHDGSLTTLHANSPKDAILRLETMCLLADVGLPVEAARRQIATAIDSFVQLERTPDGRRRVTRIVTCQPGPDGHPLLHDVWIDGPRRLERVGAIAPPRRGSCASSRANRAGAS
jgi:pilus assembly protein CpaF